MTLLTKKTPPVQWKSTLTRNIGAAALALGLTQPVFAQSCGGQPSVSVSIAGSDTLLNHPPADSAEMAPNKFLLRIEHLGDENLMVNFLEGASVKVSFNSQDVGDKQLETGVIGAGDYVQTITLGDGEPPFGPNDDGVITFPISNPLTLHSRSTVNVGAQSSFDILVSIPPTTAMTGKTRMFVDLDKLSFECDNAIVSIKKPLQYGVLLHKQPFVTVGKNVGIATTTPQAELDVNGDGMVRGKLAVGGKIRVKSDRRRGARFRTPNADLAVKGSAVVTQRLGIGTISPDTNLDVAGTARVQEKLMIGTESVNASRLGTLADFSITSARPSIDFINTRERANGWRIKNITNGDLYFSPLLNGKDGVSENGTMFFLSLQKGVFANGDLTVTGDADFEARSVRIDGVILEDLIRSEVKRIIQKECFIFQTSIPIAGINALISVHNKCLK
jgi:hypothetical protein